MLNCIITGSSARPPRLNILSLFGNDLNLLEIYIIFCKLEILNSEPC